MKPDTDHPFALLAKEVLPEQTSGRLARMADVNQRIAQRWLKGELEVPADVIARLETQRGLLQQFHPAAEIALVVAKANGLGLDPEVTGSFIAAGYEILLQRRIK